MIDVSSNEVKGRVYANPNDFMSNGQSYLWFEYFGTGEFAEEEHIGKSKHFIESGYTEWYIPVNKIDRILNYPIKMINGKQFYIAHGTKANRFLDEAEFKTRNDNIDTIEEKIKKMFEEVCK